MGVILDSLHQVGVVSRLTFREAQRRKMMWLGLILGGVFVALYAVGFYFAYRDFQRTLSSGYGAWPAELFANALMTAGLYVISFLVIVVTVLTSVGTISAEIDSGTIHTIAAKPIRRWEIVVGKWLGHALMMTVFTILMAAGVMLSTRIISGYGTSTAVSTVAVLVLESVVVLSLTMLGSSLMSTLANGVVVFMVYGLAFVGGWVEQFGAMLESKVATQIGIISSLLMPSEALWRYASALVQEGGGRSTIMQAFGPFVVVSRPTDAFIVYSVLYTLVLLFFTVRVFNKRDF
ncbi:MAG: ABC transporter permease [Anaerolineae bacterium]|nr:ABC transporter permease [Anaerolineae bacterium]